MDGASGHKQEPDIVTRKRHHIDYVLSHASKSGASAFDTIRLDHDALPEVDFDAIDLTCSIFGHALKRPFLISSMTGGPELAETINLNLAVAAAELGIAMGVGSQRVALETGALSGLAKKVRAAAKGVPLFGNLGAVQLVNGLTTEDAQRAVDMLEADALILHLNPMQELVQPGGDRNWSGVLRAIEAVTTRLDCPVIVKEVGYGLSVKTARKLVGVGIAAIDVAGRGGTDFTAVELARNADPSSHTLGQHFADWGHTTPDCLQAIRAAYPDLPLIASGGIRSGLDGAKALALGAQLFAQAGPVLRAATQSVEAVIGHFDQVEKELRAACLLTGSPHICDLRHALAPRT